MSENSGVHSCGGNGLWSVGTIGKTLPGITTKIDPATGQVLCKGRNVFMGQCGDVVLSFHCSVLRYLCHVCAHVVLFV